MIASFFSEKRVNGRAALEETINNVFGSTDWHSLASYQSYDADTVHRLYRDSLLSIYGRDGRAYICSKTILAKRKGSVKYHIIYLTKNAHGVSLMNDAFLKEEADISRSETISIDFDAQERWDQFVSSILSIGSHNPGRKWQRSDLVRESILNRFAEYPEKRHLEAVKELLERESGPRFVAHDAQKIKTTGKWRTNDKTVLEFLRG